MVIYDPSRKIERPFERIGSGVADGGRFGSSLRGGLLLRASSASLRHRCRRGMACSYSRIRRTPEGRPDRGGGSVSGGRWRSFVAPKFDGLRTRFYLRSPSSARPYGRRSHSRRDHVVSRLRLCLIRSRYQRLHARIAEQRKLRRCRPMRASSSMSARAAASALSRGAATAAYSVPTARCRVRLFRPSVQETPLLVLAVRGKPGVASDALQASRDWLRSPRTNLLAWWIPQAAILVGLLVPAPLRTAIWVTALTWMGIACFLNARRCGRTHCRYTGPYYLVMIAPVLVFASGFVSVDFFGWLVVGGPDPRRK